MASELPNPELEWERPEAALHVTREEVEARLGQVDAPIEILSGGLANLNVRVGERVLRIYRRDTRALALEAALLRRRWETFRVPVLLERGADHLVLEYVPHERLGASAAQGHAAGLALAEIHALSYERPGFLDPALEVVAPFEHGIDDLFAHGEQALARAGAPAELAAAVQSLWTCARRALEALPSPFVLLHGDYKASNLHRANDGRLLVLDWEFAYAGPPFLDVGQLLRWAPPREFSDGFASGYRERGGLLPERWAGSAQRFDCINLAGLLSGSRPGSRRARDVLARLERSVRELGGGNG